MQRASTTEYPLHLVARATLALTLASLFLLSTTHYLATLHCVLSIHLLMFSLSVFILMHNMSYLQIQLLILYEEVYYNYAKIIIVNQPTNRMVDLTSRHLCRLSGQPCLRPFGLVGLFINLDHLFPYFVDCPRLLFLIINCCFLPNLTSR